MTTEAVRIVPIHPGRAAAPPAAPPKLTSSHELCEAVTDLIPVQSWYDDANGEIGDICSWQTKQRGPWTVQLEWSNVQSRCV